MNRLKRAWHALVAGYKSATQRTYTPINELQLPLPELGYRGSVTLTRVALTPGVVMVSCVCDARYAIAPRILPIPLASIHVLHIFTQACGGVAGAARFVELDAGDRIYRWLTADFN